MPSRSNKILFGVIMLLIGMFVLAQSFLSVNIGDFTLLLAGCAFLLLYKTKRIGWTLIPGAYLCYISLIRICGNFIPTSILSRFTGAMFFAVPGIIFMVMYFSMSKSFLLVPASILIWFGAYIIMPSSILGGGSTFFICFGMSFITMYVLGRHFIKKLLFYFGLAIVLFGFMISTGLRTFVPFGNVPQIIGVALILYGIFFILKTVRKRQ